MVMFVDQMRPEEPTSEQQADDPCNAEKSPPSGGCQKAGTAGLNLSSRVSDRSIAQNDVAIGEGDAGNPDWCFPTHTIELCSTSLWNGQAMVHAVEQLTGLRHVGSIGLS